MLSKVVTYICVLAATVTPLRAIVADDAYQFTVSGVVKALPGAGRAPNELLVKHEEIPTYRNSSGKVVGMMAMTMPFYVAPTVSLSDIKVGDKIHMVVEQHLEPKFTEEVVSVSKVQ